MAAWGFCAIDVCTDVCVDVCVSSRLPPQSAERNGKFRDGNYHILKTTPELDAFKMHLILLFIFVGYKEA